MNNRGQFSIIAALLVAVVLITTVVVTYSSIRNSTLREQPPIQSAVDETNLAVKEILGFTVGYYGSILKSTGNQTYAKQLATDYLIGGLEYTANTHPEWGTSFNVTNSQLVTFWYSSASFSSGNLTVTYNLTGLGIYGMTYNTYCSLQVQVLPTVNNEAYLSVTKDGSEPLVDLGGNSFNFYRYETTIADWHMINPTGNLLSYSNGSYQIDIPSGVDVNSYMIQVEDQRGIIVVASSYSTYTCNLAWTSWNGTVAPTQQYVDNNSSDVDSSPNVGTQSNFTAMRQSPDGTMNILTEGITTASVPETWASPFTYEGSGWTSPSNAYDNSTGTRASISISSKSWSSYLILDTSAVSCHNVRYYIDYGSSVNRVQIDIYSGTWVNVYDGTGTVNAWTNVTFSEVSVTKMRLRFYNNHGSQSRSAYVYEAQFLRTGTPQNCQLDIEAQWANVNFTLPDQWLCIYGGTMASEDIRVDVRNGSTWINLFTDLVVGWNNISVSQYLDSPTLTIRFKDGTQTSDPVQSTWQVDAALLRTGISSLVSIGTSDTLVAELLQSGVIRWLGQNLQLNVQAKPVPPIPVKSIHINETVANVSSEVPFQIEDWASGYTIPMGLTNNASVFSSTNMLVFLANSNVSKVTIWWNGSDTTTQTPYAYVNRYFSDNISNADNAILSNGILSLRLERSYDATYQATVLKVTSTQNTSTATARFMRVNNKNATYGDIVSYTIYSGIIRDIVTAEAEFDNHGVPGCPNFYAPIVLTLPANATYFTYQLRLMFLDSQLNRTITDLCPLSLSIPNGGPETEDGVSGGNPNTSNSTGLFYDQSTSHWAHHWSQFISGTKGAGIMFTDDANQELYVFDSIAGNATGAIKVSNSSSNVIELQPVSTLKPASFNYALDTIWYGAIATFDGMTPIYKEASGVRTGLWTLVEYPPTVIVTTGN